MNDTFLEFYRVGVGLAFVVFAFLATMYARRNSRAMQQIATQNANRDERDRQERQKVVLELQRTTAEMAERAEKAIAIALKRDELLHEKLDKNTELTIAAAKASETALTAANSVNEKIQATQEGLMAIAKGTVVNIDMNKDKQ